MRTENHRYRDSIGTRRRKKNDTSQHEPEAVAVAVEHKDTSQQCTVATGSATPETKSHRCIILPSQELWHCCWHCRPPECLQFGFRSVHATRHCIFVLGILRRNSDEHLPRCKRLSSELSRCHPYVRVRKKLLKSGGGNPSHTKIRW